MKLKELPVIVLLLLFGARYALGQEFIIMSKEQYSSLKQNVLNGRQNLMTLNEQHKQTENKLTLLQNGSGCLSNLLLTERAGSQKELEAVLKLKETYFRCWTLSERKASFWRRTALGLGAVIAIGLGAKYIKF